MTRFTGNDLLEITVIVKRVNQFGLAVHSEFHDDDDEPTFIHRSLLRGISDPHPNPGDEITLIIRENLAINKGLI